MLKNKVKLKALLATIAVFAATVVYPFSSAFAANGITGAGQDKLANFLLAYGLYECFNTNTPDSTMNDNLLYDKPFDTVLLNSAVKSVNLGPWLNKMLSEEGQPTSKVTCETIMKNVLGADAVITSDMVNKSDGILNGAYLEEEGIGFTVECGYNIWSGYADTEDYDPNESYFYALDDSEQGYHDIEFKFAQGYAVPMPRETILDLEHLDGEHYQNHTSDGYKIQIFYDNSPSVLKVLQSSIGIELNDHLGDFIRDEFNSHITSDLSDSQFKSLCVDMIKDGDHQTINVNGTDCTGLYPKRDSWEMYLCYNLNYGRITLGIDIDGKGFHAIRAVAPKTGKLLMQPGAGSIIAGNIKQLYFNGEDPKTYLSNNPDIAYVYYGRLLFNGDGKYSDGCNGISVAADDPKIEDLNKEADWNISNKNVLKVEAFDESGNKKEYITKFDTDASKTEIKKVGGLPWENASVKCDELVSRLKDSMGFSGNATSKSDVYGYISPKSAESYITGTTQPPSGEDPPGGEEPGTPTESEADLTEYNCYTNAGSLGWIVCPIIDSLKDFIQEKYVQWVAPALQVNVELFTWGDEDGAYYAWNIFRNMANILFVIFFIIIIFSQITGYGIDSYGIKKAFPKLLVGAILINLSFILCQVAIDLGNIAGAGIGGLFHSITEKLPTVTQVNVEGVDVSSDAWSAFTGNQDIANAIIIIVGVISAAAVLSKGLAIVIPIVMAMISIAISVFALIAILGIRQAAAVLLVVASPLALACYILPNTKSIFQKWWKAFQGLLLAYPCCSALVYGGDMVSQILIRAGSGNTWLIIAAAVVSIAPIFFIPKVISNCMGAISGGMVAFANRGRNKAKGAVGKRLDNSFLTKKQKYRQQMRNQKAAARSGAYAAKRGQRIMDKYKGHEGELSAGQRRKYNAAQAAVNAQKAESENAYASTFEGLNEDEKKTKIMQAAGFAVDDNGKLIKNADGSYKRDPKAKGKAMNGDMLVAGLRSMKNSAEMGDVLKTVSGTQEFKSMMKDDAGMQQRLAGVMMGSEGNAINQSIGQLMAEGKTLDQINDRSNGLLKDRVSGMGAGVMASQKAEVFKMEGAADLFSDDQLREAAASEYSGDHQENFYNMMQHVSSGRKENIVAGMNASQVGRLRVSKVGGVDHGSLGAVGGAAMVKAKNPSAINVIKSKDGGNIRIHQQGEAASALEIDK